MPIKINRWGGEADFLYMFDCHKKYQSKKKEGYSIRFVLNKRVYML